MNYLELRHLRYFVAVAEELHFGKAAARVGIAQPPLSQQIRLLEERLGFPLLERRPKVRLTPAGKAFLPHARKTLEEAELGIRAATRMAGGETGQLRIGFPASALFTALPKAIVRYRERYPHVDLVLRELSSAEQFEALASELLDVAIVRERQETDQIETTLIAEEQLMLVVQEAHALANLAEVQLDELKNEPFVLFPRSVAPALYDRIKGLFASTGYAPNVVFEAREWVTVVALVEAGLGISVVPSSFQRLKVGSARYLPLRGAETSTRIFLCRRRGSVSATATAFCEMLLQHKDPDALGDM